MAEQSPSKSSRGAVAAILDALHPDAKGIISTLIVFLAFGATVYGFIQLPTFIKNLSSSTSKEQCWELRELQGVTWKFNKCTGEATQLASPIPKAATSSVSNSSQSAKQ